MAVRAMVFLAPTRDSVEPDGGRKHDELQFYLTTLDPNRVVATRLVVLVRRHPSVAAGSSIVATLTRREYFPRTLCDTVEETWPSWSCWCFCHFPRHPLGAWVEKELRQYIDKHAFDDNGMGRSWPRNMLNPWPCLFGQTWVDHGEVCVANYPSHWGRVGMEWKQHSEPLPLPY